MNQAELVGLVARVRVTVQRARLPVSSPSGMSHRSLGDERLSHIDDPDVRSLLGIGSGGLVGGLIGVRGVLGDQLAQRGDLADLLEEDGGRVGSVAVDTDTWRRGDHQEIEVRSKLKDMTKRNGTYRQSRILGIRVGRDHCTGLHRCTFDPSHRGTSSRRRFLQYRGPGCG